MNKNQWRKNRKGNIGNQNSLEVRRINSEKHKGKNLGDLNPSKRPEVRKKISDFHKGKPKSDKHKKNISKSKKGKPLSEKQIESILKAGKIGIKKIAEFRKGKKWDEIYGKKKADNIRTKRKLKPAWNKGKKCPQTSGKNHHMYGKKHNVNTITKIRKSTIKYKKEHNILFITIGKHEKQILDELELSNNIKILRLYEICGYIVDGYCKKLNLVIEIYEPFHRNKIERDGKRKNEIINELNCNFVIIGDNL